MTTVRVIYKPDGAVAVMRLDKSFHKEGEIYARFNRDQAKIPALKGLPYDDIDSSQVPKDRTKRHQWRGIKGNGIHIDATVESELETIQDQVKNMTLEEKIDFMLERNGYIKDI